MPKAIRAVLLGILPVLFLSMMGSLILRVQSAGKGISYLSAKGTIVDPSIGTTWYSIHRDGELIGYARTSLEYAGDNQSQYASIEETVIKVDGFGDDVFLTMQLSSVLDNAMKPLTLDGTVGLGAIQFTLTSTRQEDAIQLVLSGMGTQFERTLTFNEDLATASSAYAIAATRAQKAGEQFRFQTFDALSQADASFLLVSQGTEMIKTPDGLVEARKFTVTKSSLSSEVWLDPKGRMLREEASTYVSEITDLPSIRQFVESHPAVLESY